MKKPRILIADDYELMRGCVRGVLHSRRGWRVVAEAANGREALEKTIQLRPDVAILDISMPDLDGVHVTRRIREAVPDTKILVLTMHESDQMVQRAFDAGAHGYILKPDLPEALPKAVEAVLEGKRFLQQAERAGARATPREIEIIRLLAEGKTNKATAALLGITVRTVETHRSKIMLKLGLHSLADLIHYAIRQGLVAPGGPKVARPDKAAHPAFAKTRAV